MKKTIKRLVLCKETLGWLEPGEATEMRGGYSGNCITTRGGSLDPCPITHPICIEIQC